ncbi:hypothetical protein ACN28I_16770 [Archangium gephyra]|uniref:hypothetical protein n=1 Tax=Archangium gephyra TaxID=48 RepID=UPI003B7E419A
MGNHFAMMEKQLIVATMVQRLNVELVDDKELPRGPHGDPAPLAPQDAGKAPRGRRHPRREPGGVAQPPARSPGHPRGVPRGPQPPPRSFDLRWSSINMALSSKMESMRSTR